jgi:hypothetical protein
MKKITLLALFSLYILNTYAQCIPDPNWNGYGLNPSILPNGTVGTNYSTIISFKTPKDSIIVYSGQTYNAIIDSARVELIKNYPSNYTWACNKPTCTWSGGEKGCALLSGKPDSNNFRFYEIKVFVRSWISIVGLSFQIERLDSSTIDYYIDGGKNSLKSISNIPAFSVFPNPAKNNLQIDVVNLNGNSFETQITDLTGKIIYSKNLNANNNNVDVSALPKGMYFISFKNEDFNYTQKLILE